MDILIFSVIVLVLAGFGKKLFSCVVPGACVSFPEEAVISFAFGAGSAVLLVLGIGLAGLLYRWLLIVSLAGLGVFTSKEIAALLHSAKAWAANILRKDLSSFERFILGAILFVGLLTLMGSLSPIIGMDSAAYHMQDAKVFIQQHQVIHIPYTRESLWPFFVQMLYVLGLCLKGVILAKLFHYSFYVASFVAIYALCRRYWPHPNSILSAAVFSLTPAIFTVTTYAYTDLAVVFYTIMAFYGFFFWLETSSTRWFCLSGIMAGFLMGIKITSASVPAVILTLYGCRIFFTPTRIKQKIKQPLVFILAMMMVCGVWYLRSWIILGNPIYPFAAHLFGGAGYPESVLGYQTTAGIGWGPAQFILMLWPLTFAPDLFGGESIGPLFLIFLPLLAFARKPDRYLRYVLAIALCLYAAWFFVYQYTRFFYPTLIFLSILVGFVYYDFCAADPFLRQAASSVLIVVFCYSGVLATYHNFDKIPVALGFQTGKEYLLKHERSFEIADYVNTHLPKDAKILCLVDPRLFYFNRPAAMGHLIEMDYRLSGKYVSKLAFDEYLRQQGFGDYMVVMRDLSLTKPSAAPQTEKDFFSAYSKQLLKQIEFRCRDEHYIYELWKVGGKVTK